MNSQDEGVVFARKMIKDLSQHVQFPEEELGNLDKLQRAGAAVTFPQWRVL